MAQFSYDIVSDYDIAEITNAVSQSAKEILQRYDFKGTSASIELIENKTQVLLKGNEFQLDMILEILRSKMAKRGIAQATVDTSSNKEEGNPWRWRLRLQSGLDQDKAKSITKLIREKFPKLKTQIQGKEVRVIGSSKDELQQSMQLIEKQDYTFPIRFTNFR